MQCYASNTRTRRNLEQFRRHGWRVLIGPDNPKPPEGIRVAADNGAWGCFQSGLPFNSDGFLRMLERYGSLCDWIVIPDKVAAGRESLEFSESWMPQLKHFKLLLLAVQDGMEPEDVTSFMRCHPNVSIGIFLGGSTEWKLRTMYGWGMVAHALGVYYHVARVNSVRRIRLAQEAGAYSIDGTSGTMFSLTVPKLNRTANQPSLLTPKSLAVTA